MSNLRIENGSDVDHSGFTLMEILVVVLLIGMLMTLVSTRLFSRLDESKITLAGGQLQKLSQQLELYKLDNGRYPTGSQGLRALVTEPNEEPVPRRYPKSAYARSADLQDPWGTQYTYEQPGTHNAHSYDLFSLGPDGVASEDDVTNWEDDASQP
jgi:general secretion pathway protein G